MSPGAAATDAWPSSVKQANPRFSENPNPSMYEKRELNQEQLNRGAYAGIQESFWVPISVPFTPGPRRFVLRSLRDLKGYLPTQLDFTMEHPREDRTDEWFESMLQDLFHRIRVFATQQFGFGPAFPENATNPWKTNFSPQFIEFTSQIARRDERVGDWDTCLKDNLERTYLVMGLISKVLHEAIFSELLFGCEDEANGGLNSSTTRLLDNLDKDMLRDDGFNRKIQRTVQVRRILAGRIVPGRFWQEVDGLATQTMAMLLPLINLQGTHAPDFPWPRLVELHQELHNIIAQAGYTAVCMSWSKTIFDFTFPNPGQYWDHTEMNQLDDRVFLKSKERATEYDIKRLKLMSAPSLPKKASASDAQDEAANRQIQKAVDAELQHKLPFRVAKVKITTWPLVQRYRRIGNVDDNGATGAVKISRISKAQVVYYHGLSDNKEGESKERYPLHDYMAGVNRKLFRKWWLGYLLLGTFLLCLLCYISTLVPQVGLGRKLVELGRALGRLYVEMGRELGRAPGRDFQQDILRRSR